MHRSTCSACGSVDLLDEIDGLLCEACGHVHEWLDADAAGAACADDADAYLDAAQRWADDVGDGR